MKKLLPYTVVASFIVLFAGIYFGPYVLAAGSIAMIASYTTGVLVLGSDDKDFRALMSKLELQAQSNESSLKKMVLMADQAHSKVSESLAELRREQSGRWPDRS